MWAVSIGATDEHGPLAGAVYVPALGEMFSGARTEGATVNGLPISVRDNNDIADALVCTGYSYLISEREVHAKRVADIVMKVRDLRRFGAAAIDLCVSLRADALMPTSKNTYIHGTSLQAK
jgi:myo-inositol-1(or 4)-monophosphatase